MVVKMVARLIAKLSKEAPLTFSVAMASVPTTISGVGQIFVLQVGHHYGQRLKPKAYSWMRKCVRDREGAAERFC
jgi:hypothetical protein